MTLVGIPGLDIHVESFSGIECLFELLQAILIALLKKESEPQKLSEVCGIVRQLT